MKSSRESNVAIRLSGITHVYPVRKNRSNHAQRALDSVTLSFRCGEVTALMGANGSGKSTIVRLIAGGLEPSSGSAEILGFQSGSAEARKRLGVVFQKSALDELHTVDENLRLQASLLGLRSNGESEIRRCIGLYKLTDRRYDRVSTLSGGMKRRVELARAQLGKPEVVLMDEPEAGLDVLTQRDLLAHCVTTAESGRCVVVATHDSSFASRCDRVIMLRKGSVVVDDSPKEACERVGEQVATVSARAWQAVRGDLDTAGLQVVERVDEVLVIGSKRDVERFAAACVGAGVTVTVGRVDLATVMHVFADDQTEIMNEALS